jgi:hypothetical protein
MLDFAIVDEDIAKTQKAVSRNRIKVITPGSVDPNFRCLVNAFMNNGLFDK